MILYLENDNKDKYKNDETDLDIVFIVSLVILITTFVLGILLSDKVIKFPLAVELS